MSMPATRRLPRDAEGDRLGLVEQLPKGRAHVRSSDESLAAGEAVAGYVIHMEQLQMAHPYDYGERLDVFEVLPQEFSSVLDVGCSRGGFCALVKRARPECQVWGIEPDRDAADEASSRTDRIVIGQFPQDMPADAPQFDVITFSDVLEHLVEPGEALSAASSKLTSNGVVIASIPNIRHWRGIKSIVIEGDFTYTETGLFDRTHLRFFTRSTMLRLFEECGFRVETCVPSNMMSHRSARLLRRLFPRFGGEITTLHYIIRGRPESEA